MLNIAIQTPDWPGQMETILAELRQLRESNALLKKRQTEINVRQLENILERAVILNSGPVLKVPLGDLRSPMAPYQDVGRCQTLEEVERKHILATLKQTGGIVSGPKGAAARLGIKRSTLHFRMKKLGIVRNFDAKPDLGQVDESSPSFA